VTATTHTDHGPTHLHEDVHDDHAPGHVHHEAGAPPAGGPVVVDIGGDVGALVVATGAAWLGRELHVRREGEERTTHTGVWDRGDAAAPEVVAVFPHLVEGRYELLDATGAPMVVVTVEGGRVARLDLRP